MNVQNRGSVGKMNVQNGRGKLPSWSEANNMNVHIALSSSRRSFSGLLKMNVHIAIKSQFLDEHSF